MKEKKIEIIRNKVDQIDNQIIQLIIHRLELAEEIGKSIRVLELFGLAGIKTLNQYYNLRAKKKFENSRKINSSICKKKNE